MENGWRCFIFGVTLHLSRAGIRYSCGHKTKCRYGSLQFGGIRKTQMGHEKIRDPFPQIDSILRPQYSNTPFRNIVTSL